MRDPKCDIATLLFAACAAFALPTPAWTMPDAIGYSGAPGTGGSCAVHCHGSSGGSITVSGFPADWTPGDTYTVRVGHHGGEVISNFNASVRAAGNTPIAGTLLPGPNMESYTSETDIDALHFTSANQDSGWFQWIAPGSEFDSVELYLSGMQGQTSHGLSTLVRLIARRMTGMAGQSPLTPVRPGLELDGSIVTDLLVLRARVPAGIQARISVLDAAGRRVAAIADRGSVRDGEYLLWQPYDSHGLRLAPGRYFTVLTGSGFRVLRQFTLVR